MCNPTFYYIYQPNCQSFLSERKLFPFNPYNINADTNRNTQTVIEQQSRNTRKCAQNLCSSQQEVWFYSPAGYSNLQSTKTACPVLVLVSRIRPSSIMTSASNGHHVPGPSYSYSLLNRGHQRSEVTL